MRFVIYAHEAYVNLVFCTKCLNPEKSQRYITKKYFDTLGRHFEIRQLVKSKTAVSRNN
jgi:hypothetical protein